MKPSESAKRLRGIEIKLQFLLNCPLPLHACGMAAVADDVGSFRLTLAICTAILAVGFRSAPATGMRAFVFWLLIRHDLTLSADVECTLGS
jgi:hypothetical protein